MSFVPEYRPEDIYLRRKNFVADGSDYKLKLGTKFDDQTCIKTIDLFVSSLLEIRNEGYRVSHDEKMRRIQSADLYLRALVDQHKAKIDKGLSGCKDNALLMSICKLDRYVTAEKFPFLQSAAPLSAEKVKCLYQTKLSQETLDKWLNQKTHDGYKSSSNDQEHKLVHSEFAAEAFLHHPDEYDFITQAYIHRQMSRLNEHIEIDPVTKHHRIRYDGAFRDVTELCKILRPSSNSKLIPVTAPRLEYEKRVRSRAEDDESNRYYYTQAQGLCKHDPEKWKELPVYRARKHARSDDDYRVVIKTINNETTHPVNHAWLEIKTPEHVYNVGFFPDEQFDVNANCNTVPGILHSPDKSELLGLEKDIKKTVCKISKEQFLALKTEIESFQSNKKVKVFNLIRSNCSTWARQILSKIGIDISSQENLTRYIDGKNFQFAFNENSIIGKIQRLAHKFFAFMRNFLMYIMGGSKSKIPKGEFDEELLAFRSFKDVFDLKRGLFDFPKRIRDWQYAVDKSRNKKIEAFKSDPANSHLSEEDMAKSIEQIRYAIPSDVKLADASMTF
jgi:hypothetical protein